MKRRNHNFDNIESLLSKGVEIVGNLSAQGSVRIDGKVEGKINIKGDLIIGEQGCIKGEVTAANLKLAGKIEGNAIINERFDLTSTGRMAGDVQCKVLTIDEGGLLDGTTRMGQASDRVQNGKGFAKEKAAKAEAR